MNDVLKIYYQGREWFDKREKIMPFCRRGHYYSAVFCNEKTNPIENFSSWIWEYDTRTENIDFLGIKLVHLSCNYS